MTTSHMWLVAIVLDITALMHGLFHVCYGSCEENKDNIFCSNWKHFSALCKFYIHM